MGLGPEVLRVVNKEVLQARVQEEQLVIEEVGTGSLEGFVSEVLVSRI